MYLKRFGLVPFAVAGPVVRRFALVGTGANLAAGVEVGMGAVVAPSATPFGRRTTNSTATSFPFRVVGFHSDPGAHWVACWPQSAHTVRPAPLWSAMTLTDVGSE